MWLTMTSDKTQFTAKVNTACKVYVALSRAQSSLKLVILDTTPVVQTRMSPTCREDRNSFMRRDIHNAYMSPAGKGD